MTQTYKNAIRPGGLLIGDRAFYSHVVSIVLPIVIQNTVSNVVSLLDNVMVGAVGTLEMSSVAIVNQLLFIFYLCIFGGLAGAGIFSTQYAGAKDEDGVRHCFRIKWMIAIAMLIAALVVVLSIPDLLIRLYLADGTGEQEAMATLRWRPPVQPMAMVSPSLPSSTYSGRRKSTSSCSRSINCLVCW